MATRDSKIQLEEEDLDRINEVVAEAGRAATTEEARSAARGPAPATKSAD
jgi:hypothetical protein